MFLRSFSLCRLALLLPCLCLASQAWALEFPIGMPVQKAGMEFIAVYLQPVEMEPKGMMLPVLAADLHMELDVKALAHNPNGFQEGTWVPGLVVSYELTKLAPKDAKAAAGAPIQGEFMPMVASDGPHYGNNIKLRGPGQYHLKLLVSPPGMASHFGRHTDRETGVAPWFEPIKLEFDFAFAGVGKKGGY